MSAEALARISAEVEACRACPRLVEWREQVAAEKVARFADQAYWGRPLAGFGDPDAWVAIVGLAPAAHGGNRTGRIFTGDRSGDTLYASLHRVGFASQAESVARDDGMVLTGAWVTAVNRCAPPANKPTPEERDRCLPYLERELAALAGLQAVVALGSYAWDGVLRALAANGRPTPRPKPKFGHAIEIELGGVSLIGCFHPSQQNTFTGKLTPPMMDEVLARAWAIGGTARS